MYIICSEFDNTSVKKSLNGTRAVYPHYDLVTLCNLFSIKTDAAGCSEELVEPYRNIMALRKGLT